MRLALCAASVNTILRAEPKRKKWLADLLDVTPFERMTDEMLVETAYNADVDNGAIARIVSEVSDVRHTISARFRCGVCCDSSLVPADSGGWKQCPRCTVAPLVEPPT